MIARLHAWELAVTSIYGQQRAKQAFYPFGSNFSQPDISKIAGSALHHNSASILIGPSFSYYCVMSFCMPLNNPASITWCKFAKFCQISYSPNICRWISMLLFFLLSWCWPHKWIVPRISGALIIWLTTLEAWWSCLTVALRSKMAEQ